MPAAPMRAARVVALFGAIAVAASGCTLLSESDDQAGDATVIELATHDSWNVPKKVISAFERRSGIDLKIRKQGEAGALTNKLVLTKDNPIADVAYGVDSTFASRALSEGVFVPYTSPKADHGPQRYATDPKHRLSAVDIGDVCVNIDVEWFAEHDVPQPKSYSDLTKPAYADLMVVESPATSSPGLAFLLGTVAEFGGNGWLDYWRALKANGLKVVSGWTEAYTQSFSGSAGNGPRPIVVSYASSPAAEVGADGEPRTKALLDTCYRQVEYAGVLKGTDHPKKARQVIDFLLSERFQSIVSENMYVYPTRAGVPLPDNWDKAAPLPDDPAKLDGEQVAQHRKEWIEQWRTLFT